MSRAQVQIFARRTSSSDEFRLSSALSIDANIDLNSCSALEAEFISEIHDLHRDLGSANPDARWTYFPVAEWQPNMSALPDTFDVALRVLAKANNISPISLIFRDQEAALLCRKILEERGVGVKISAWDQTIFFLRQAKKEILRLTNIFAWVLEHAGNMGKIKQLQIKPLGRPNARVDVLFLTRFEKSVANSYVNSLGWRDEYLGDLIPLAVAKNASCAIVGRCGLGPPHIAHTVSQFTPVAMSTIYSWVQPRDLLAIAIKSLRQRLKVPSNPTRLAQLAKRESRFHTRAFADCLLVEYAVKNAIAFYKPKKIVSMQENAAWEMAVPIAAAEAEAVPKTIGYFHCPAAPAAFRYRSRPDVAALRPSFDTTFTLGSAAQKCLCQLGQSSDRYLAGAGFRNPGLQTCLSLPSKTAAPIKRVLILLGGSYDNLEFCLWVKKALAGQTQWEIALRPHPVFPAQELLDALCSDGESHGTIKLSNDVNIADALQESDCVIYKGTTACFAALAAGIPAVHVSHAGLGSDDALFFSEGLSSSVSMPNELVKELNYYSQMEETEAKILKQKRREYVREYYDISPATKEKILNAILFDTR